MNKTDTFLIGLSFVLFIATGYLPSVLYIYGFSNMLLPFVLLVTVLYVMSFSRMGAVTLALAFIGLFVEYRKRVMARQPMTVSDPAPEYEKQLAPAPPVVPDEVHPVHGEPADETIGYKPMEEANGEFERVGSSVDQKGVLPSESFPESTEKFLVSQGLV